MKAAKLGFCERLVNLVKKQKQKQEAKPANVGFGLQRLQLSFRRSF